MPHFFDEFYYPVSYDHHPDFNNLRSNDLDASLFSETIDAIGLTPHVSLSTHKPGHTLSHVYTTLDGQINIGSNVVGTAISRYIAAQGGGYLF